MQKWKYFYYYLSLDDQVFFNLKHSMTLNPHSEKQNLSISIPGDTENLTLKKTNIIIGANGSGKTRFASWLQCESVYKGKVWRIAAHKSLGLSESFNLTDTSKAQRCLHFGNENWNTGEPPRVYTRGI